MQTAVTAALFWAVLLAFPAGPARAQVDDPQTDDHADQDRRYYERYKKKTEEKTERPLQEATSATDLRQEFLSRAEELVQDRNYRSSSSDRYRVQTDDPRLRPAGAVGLLDEFRDFFDGFWQGKATLKPYDEKSRVFLFYSFHKYNQLLHADFSRNVLRPKGHYVPTIDVLAVHTDPDNPGGLGDALIHEAAHQLVDQRLLGADADVPVWLSEGLASYFGFTQRDAEDGFLTGQIGHKALKLAGERPSSRQASTSVRKAKRALSESSSDDAPLVERLLRMRDPGQFYSGDVNLHYAVSWAIVHYLLHGDEGAHTAAFVRYIETEAAGNGDAQALLDELGMTGPELHAAVRKHLGKMNVH